MRLVKCPNVSSNKKIGYNLLQFPPQGEFIEFELESSKASKKCSRMEENVNFSQENIQNVRGVVSTIFPFINGYFELFLASARRAWVDGVKNFI